MIVSAVVVALAVPTVTRSIERPTRLVIFVFTEVTPKKMLAARFSVASNHIHHLSKVDFIESAA